VHRWMRELSQLGRLDACIGGQDRDSARDAVEAIRDAHNGWRQSAADFWGG
jgi:hypothetical protein